MSLEITPDILSIVAQFIGSSIKSSGVVDCIDMSEISICETTWEEFVNYVFDYMVINFIIEKPDNDKFLIGIKWIKEQNWKG